MSIILSDLFVSSKSIYHLQLIAGEDGLNSPIHWVQFTEDIETTNFLKGGELIFTTGMSSKSENWLFDFVTSLIQQKTCGLIVNTGRYVFSDAISEDVINLCTQYQFPLFTMPWKVHLATIMQDYCNRIFMQSYQEDRTTMAFQRLLFHPNDLETSVDTLNSLGYETTSSYLTIISQNLEAPSFFFGNLRKLGTKYYMFRIEESFIFILQDASLKSITDKLASFSDEYFASIGCSVCFGIGDISDSLLKLHNSYNHAIFALKTAQKLHLKYMCFNDLGIFKLFFSVENKEILSDMCTNNLSILENYDLKSNTNLVETLRLYIENDGSIQAVADASFTHRNTINYRMKKIRQLLNTDILSMEDKFDLRIAFLIKDFLSL